MRVLLFSTRDEGGGAEQVARALHVGLRAAGHESILAVGRRAGDLPGVVELPNDMRRTPWASYWRQRQARWSGERSKWTRLASWLGHAGEPERWWRVRQGYEDFDFPGTLAALDHFEGTPDLIHCHNLHGGYFDLRALPALSARAPLILTLHDEWLLTGHCAYTLGCERWASGCGQCPNLDTYPAVRRDNTAANWTIKRGLFADCRLHVASPSQWLLDRARRSPLAAGIVESRLIPYGVDLEVFRPGSAAEARAAIGIGEADCVAVYAAHRARTNPFKDFATIERAVSAVAQRRPGRRHLLVVVGDEAPTVDRAGLRIEFRGHVRDRRTLARYYQAADVFLHAARADNFPNTVLEAMACGAAVLATDVGGIAEQLGQGACGVLVPPQDPSAMAAAMDALFTNEPRRLSLGAAARERAEKLYSNAGELSAYLGWYQALAGARRATSTT